MNAERLHRCILYAAATCLAAGSVGAAVYGQMTRAPRIPSTVHVMLPTRKPSIYQVSIVDPFQSSQGQIAQASIPGSVAQGQAPAYVPKLGTLSVPNLGPLPNIGGGTAGSAAGSSPPQGTTYTLQATLIGHPNLAEFQSENDMQILRVGDMLGNRKIARITYGEVDFVDGTRVQLAEDSASTTPGTAVSASPVATSPPLNPLPSPTVAPSGGSTLATPAPNSSAQRGP